MKKLFLISVLILGTVTANAQFKLGVNGGVQIPIGNFGDVANVGFGGGINAEYLLNESFGLGLDAGYYNFGTEIDGFSFNMIPITVGAKYYFLTEGIQPYAGAGLGIYGFGADSETNWNFGLAPVIGMQFALSDTFALDLNVKYNHVFTKGSATSTFGINVGVVYKFGN